MAEDLCDHLPHDLPLLGRRVEGFAQAPVTKEGDARDRVVEIGEGRDRKNVARDLLRALLDRSGEPLAPVAPRATGKQPEVALLHGGRENLGQTRVGVLLAAGRPLEQLPLRDRHRRDREVALADLDVALRDLLGVVEGMGVEEAPEKLARDVLQRELEVRVLKGRVVAGVVDRAGDRVAAIGPRGGLVLRDDPLGGIAGPRRRDDVLVGALEGMHEAHPRRRRGEAEGMGLPNR